MAQLKKGTTLNGVNILDFFYPIGTLYYTVDDSFNPSEHFGGEWTKIEGRFVYGRESSQNSLVTGGEKEHTLTIDEMPSHNHTFKKVCNSAGSYGYAVGSATTNATATNHSLDMNLQGGGYLTTICHLTSLPIFGREQLKTFYDFVIDKVFPFISHNRKEILIWQN